MFYIHYDDPQFFAEPWPGQRRLGPYLTLEEAQAQAISDSATGGGTGEIYSADDSDSNTTGLESVTPIVSYEEVKKAGDALRQRIFAEAHKARVDDAQALSAQLPAGITIEDLQKAGLIN